MGAYNAVHNQESREELYAKRDELSEMDLSLISDVELDEIAEVALQELFEKGFTVNQADAIFDNLITEAKVTYGHDTESARQAKVQRLKGALKGAIGKARMKSARGAVAAYGAYRSAKQTADDIRRRTTQTAKNVSAQTAKKASEAKAGVKTGLKGMIKKAAEKVASKASGVAKRMDEAKKGDGNLANNYPPYDKVTRGDIIAGAKGEDQMGGKKKKMKEEFELDQIVESLVERGHTEQEAYALVAQFTFSEGYQRNPEKGEKEDKKYAPVRGEKTPMPPRGNKRREDFEKWYAKQMSEGYDEPKMHSAVKRVMRTQPAAKGRAASRLHSKYSMRSKGNIAGETDGPGPNAPKRSGRKGRGAETDRGSGNAAKRRMEG